jgi:hypothetical protein
MNANIMSWSASISLLIGSLHPALCYDWLSDVMRCNIAAYVLYTLCELLWAGQPDMWPSYAEMMNIQPVIHAARQYCSQSMTRIIQ